VQQFTIPQFIDVEDKIIGPITTRQFVIMLSGFFLIAACYKLFDFSLFVVSGLFILIVFGLFAFIKINGRPFHFFALNVIQTMRRPRLRVWNHLISWINEQEEAPAPLPPAIPSKHYTFSRLAEMSLIVDTGGGYKGEGGEDAKIENMNI
jgi:hypothetical protein